MYIGEQDLLYSTLQIVAGVCGSTTQPDYWYDWSRDVDQDVDLYTGRGQPLSGSERALVTGVTRTVQSKVALAKAGKVTEACENLYRLEAKLSSLPLFRNTRLFLDSVVSAALAYANFRLHEFDKACELLLKAMECDEELETVFGWTFRHLHRVHMVENKMVMLLRVGRFCEGFELYSQLLAYTSGVAHVLPISGSWSNAQIREVDRIFLELKNMQLCSHIARALKVCGEKDAQWLASICESVAISDKPLLADNSSVHFWLAGKLAFLNSDSTQFLTTLNQWSSIACRKDIRLFADSLTDLGSVCRASGNQRMFVEQITPKLEMWSMVSEGERRMILEGRTDVVIQSK